MKTHLLAVILLVNLSLFAQEKSIVVSNLTQLAEVAARDGQNVKLLPGTYRMADYLTDGVLKEIRAGVDRKQTRPPVPMLVFRGSNNRFDLREVTIEIDTALYRKLPQGGYTRCLIITGTNNWFDGLSIHNSGPNQGSGGNILSVAGASNTLENVTLHVRGSFPYGYGDVLGKGGPNLVPLQKQSGIQVLGNGSVLRRCRVFSRAFGHCFYIQEGTDILIEDCYAEGAMRATSEMLRDTNGPACELGFKSVYENRDGRYVMTPGYMKSLSEDGFRTYGSAGRVTLINCTAVNTRAGFEIGAPDNSPVKTLLRNCVARGCERAYLLGSQTIVRQCRGDAKYGPLLYLRGGRESDVELELDGGVSDYAVHALATIAGTNHIVKLTGAPGEVNFPGAPILFGFGMPMHAEMSSPIKAAAAYHVTVNNEIPNVAVISSAEIADCTVTTPGKQLSDADLKKSPGNWGVGPMGK
ncbi:MAG: hypothetical protein RLY20_3157 [Verrucomicrobiota bacterium]